jgi:hypothetical protein
MWLLSIIRLIFAANVLAAEGHQVRIIPPNSENSIQAMPDPRGGLFAAAAPRDADVLVFQRVTFAPMVEAIRKYRERGIAVVVDIDDDLDRIDPRNPAWAMLHPLGGTGQSWVTASQACAAATMVTVSTPALLPRYAPGGNGVVLPNFVPSLFLQIPRHDSRVFGWGGSLHSHNADVPQLGDSVGRLMREGHQFRVVGPGDGMRDVLGLPWEPDATGGLQIHNWAAGLSTLGVGVAPLADTVFNSAKSWLKLLEKASVGVPTVFSPRSQYMALHKATGVGIPASKPKEWYRELKRLIEEDGYRRQLSIEYRAAVSHFTVDRNAWRWAEVWAAALKRQRQSAQVFSRV